MRRKRSALKTHKESAASKFLRHSAIKTKWKAQDVFWGGLDSYYKTTQKAADKVQKTFNLPKSNGSMKGQLRRKRRSK